jgi:serine/threonine-protein kinase RsbW
MHETARGKTIRLIIDNHLEDVFLIGLSTQALCSYAPFNEVEAYQVQLAVVEAVTNVIRHAYEEESNQDVELSVSIHWNRMVFQVLDRGKKIPDFSKKELEFDSQVLQSVPEGGMGLFIIQNVMDEITYQSDQGLNILTMIKYFKNPSKP